MPWWCLQVFWARSSLAATPSGIVFKTTGLDEDGRCSQPAHLSQSRSHAPPQVSFLKLQPPVDNDSRCSLWPWPDPIEQISAHFIPEKKHVVHPVARNNLHCLPLLLPIFLQCILLMCAACTVRNGATSKRTICPLFAPVAPYFPTVLYTAYMCRVHC